jgi:ParB family chromosome partitioning protein
LSVREAERLAGASAKKPGGRKAAAKDADTRALERDLAAKLGLKVEIRHRGGQGGTLTVHYTMLEQLDDVIERLGLGGPAKKLGIQPAAAEKPPAPLAVALRPVKPTGTG